MTIGNFVLWETQHNNADWVCFKTQTLLATLTTKISLMWCLVYVGKSNICTDQLDVQEADSKSNTCESGDAQPVQGGHFIIKFGISSQSSE